MAHKQVTVAEFRKNLKGYLDLLESGVTVEVRGLTLTHLKDPVHDTKVMYTPGKKDLWIDPPQNNEPHIIESMELKYNCDKCKKPAECRKWTEEGEDYKICSICALKSKLPWHKLEKLQ